MKIAYIYHSPDGDRELFAHAEPGDNRVDLFDKKGVLDIGSCLIEGRTGGCSPKVYAEGEVPDIEDEPPTDSADDPSFELPAAEAKPKAKK